MKTPLTYYGGKQRLAETIIGLIPEHTTYTEAFVGGGAIFWSKERCIVEVINDNNREIINFYEVVQNEFVELEKYIRISLYSRSLHNDAVVMYNNPHLFTRIQRAWALWVLANQSFAGKLNNSWGYDKKTKKTSASLITKRDSFTYEYAARLQSVQLECTDALRVIVSRDHPGAFHYCDPPYVGSDCGHYKSYTMNDFEALLKILESIEGKFLLSSYPNDLLKKYTRKNNWFTKTLEQKVSVAQGVGKGGKRKIEVLTGNYNIA